MRVENTKRVDRIRAGTEKKPLNISVSYGVIDVGGQGHLRKKDSQVATSRMIFALSLRWAAHMVQVGTHGGSDASQVDGRAGDWVKRK